MIGNVRRTLEFLLPAFALLGLHSNARQCKSMDRHSPDPIKAGHVRNEYLSAHFVGKVQSHRPYRVLHPIQFRAIGAIEELHLQIPSWIVIGQYLLFLGPFYLGSFEQKLN